jgi:GNAT superfamily N-acetyltransferase
MSGNNALEIRPATFDDLQDIAAIHVKVWQQAYIGQVPQAYLDGLDVKARRQKWEDLFSGQAAEDRNLYLALQGGKSVGFISFGRSRDDPKQGEIYAIYVLQEAWGDGAGYALFKAAIQDLQKDGYQVAHLWVLETNKRAIQSYARWAVQWTTNWSRMLILVVNHLKKSPLRFDWCRLGRSVRIGRDRACRK